MHTETYYHLLMEEHDSTSNDYRELMMCLKKHQLALQSVPREVLSFVHNSLKNFSELV